MEGFLGDEVRGLDIDGLVISDRCNWDNNAVIVIIRGVQQWAFRMHRCVQVRAWKDVVAAMGKLVEQWSISWAVLGSGVEIDV